VTSEQKTVNNLPKPAGANVLCIYHDDPDGQCSAAVVRRYYGPDLMLHAMEIGDPIPWQIIKAAQAVILVDFSFDVESMVRLSDSKDFVWVDHHVSALEQLGEAMAAVPGERTIEEAGCVLTWRTFFPEQEVPEAVALIGDRDIWRMALEDTRQFGEGIYQRDMDPANDELWQPLLDDDDDVVGALVEQGGLLYQARLRQISEMVERYGFEADFEGHRTLALNHRGNGDMGEHIRNLGYPLAYCYIEAVRDERRQTFVTLYSDQIDVSLIARKYGGGGHKGAAGFQFSRPGEPFPESPDTTS
jgi:oligoribonuclease NrnB/cAMP/cGMP phosphodiesterase (DHH superfamily)